MQKRANKRDDYRRITRRVYGTGSGGEKALMLTLPRFAAASAHYNSAPIAGPRLIMLDEAFAGIDVENRAQSMAVLQAFDLDFLMTSENDRGCYPRPAWQQHLPPQHRPERPRRTRHPAGLAWRPARRPRRPRPRLR